jgi:hypothetical protein
LIGHDGGWVAEARGVYMFACFSALFLTVNRRDLNPEKFSGLFFLTADINQPPFCLTWAVLLNFPFLFLMLIVIILSL